MSDEAYVGVPFVDGGRDLTAGLDCWGLVKLFLEAEAGVAALPDYGAVSAKELLAVAREVEGAVSSPSWVPISRREARRFDVVTMVCRDRVDGRPVNVVSHVGVMVDPRRVLHIELAAASALVRLDHASVAFRIVGFYRHRELVDQ